VARAYAGEKLAFGPEYLIPKPFDPRLMMKIAPAVAEAAASGVAQRPIADMEAYREKLQTFVYASGTTMKPIFDAARLAAKKRVAYAEGEEERVLRAAQIVVDEAGAADADRPPGHHRPAHREVRPAPEGRRGLRRGQHRHDHRYRDFWQTYHRMTERKGITVQMAKIEMRRRLTLIGSMLLHKGEVDGLICGTWGTTANHLHYIDQVIGRRRRAVYACMNGLLLPSRQLFLVDTHVNYDPSAEQLARSPPWPPRRCCASASRPRRAAVALQLRHQRPAQRLKMRRTWRCCASRRPGWRWTARCTATWRWTAARR
jgi:malate dehydrogenase (oxaloacetate-decarboxylating)(NADP+)